MGVVRTPKSPEVLVELAREQLYFLISSAAAYDEGRTAEAKRLAVCLRVLLHSTGQSHALLDQTGHRERLRFLDTTGELDERNLLTQAQLVIMRFSRSIEGDVGEYLPRLGDLARNQQPALATQVRALAAGGKAGRRPGMHLEFERWWRQDVLDDNEGHRFSRRRLVLALANEEGGAHVDPVSRADYDAVANSNSLGWTVGDGTPMTSPVPPSVRQIAWEVHTTVFNQAPTLLPEEYRGTRPPRRHAP